MTHIENYDFSWEKHSVRHDILFLSQTLLPITDGSYSMTTLGEVTNCIRNDCKKIVTASEATACDICKIAKPLHRRGSSSTISLSCREQNLSEHIKNTCNSAGPLAENLRLITTAIITNAGRQFNEIVKAQLTKGIPVNRVAICVNLDEFDVTDVKVCLQQLQEKPIDVSFKDVEKLYKDGSLQKGCINAADNEYVLLVTHGKYKCILTMPTDNVKDSGANASGDSPGEKNKEKFVITI